LNPVSCLPVIVRRGTPSFPDMLVVEDVVAAVTVLSITLRAVTKVHIGVGLVSDAADCTTVEVLIIAPGGRQDLVLQLSSSILQAHSDITGKEDEEVSQ